MLDIVISWLVDIGMAVGPILGYVSQYQLIKKSKSVGSFSIDICGILLFANILRLNFFIFKRYETALVFQSLFMISMQMLLLYQCAKYPTNLNQEQKQAAQQSEPALSSSKNYQCEQVEKFWRWNGFQKYGVTVLFFIFCSFSLSLICNLTPIAKGYGELVGVIALISQSVLIVPQIIKNIERQSTKGLSRMLVSLNLSGDIFKLIYFLANKQPFQFILCGIIQVILDSFVIIQIFYYGSGQKKSKKQQMDEKMSPVKASKIEQIKESPQSDANLNFEIQLQSQKEMQKNVKNLQTNNNQNEKEGHKQTNDRFGDYYSLNQQIQNEDHNEEGYGNTKIAKSKSENDNSFNTQLEKMKNKLSLNQKFEQNANSSPQQMRQGLPNPKQTEDDSFKPQA